jgi:hypothetical protein
MVAMNASDWPAFLAADTRLHALDEFTHRLFRPVMDGLAAAKPTVTRIERVVLYQRADGSVSLQDDEEQLSQDVTVEPPDDAQPDPAFDPDLDPVNVVPLPTSLPIYGFQTGHRRKPP